MSILSPSPGEVIDRISILHLKIKARNGRRMHVSPMMAELAALNGYLLSWNGACKNVEELRKSSYALNEEIWKLEDEVRSLPSTAVLDLAKVAKKIAEKNDQRMKLVAEIDRAFGWNELADEKIYGFLP